MNLFYGIEQEAKEFFSGINGTHSWDHVVRVYRLCIRVGEVEKVDMEVLKVAALLHDIGRREEDGSLGKICHAELGASLARQILEKYNFEKVDEVVHCVETHRFRKGKAPETLEAKSLFDADKLDSIGAVGVGRAFYFSGSVGGGFHDPNPVLEVGRGYTHDDTPYREFMIKLSKIKERLFTNEGRRIAEGRQMFMVNFFDRFVKAVEGVL